MVNRALAVICLLSELAARETGGDWLQSAQLSHA